MQEYNKEKPKYKTQLQTKHVKKKNNEQSKQLQSHKKQQITMIVLKITPLTKTNKNKIQKENNVKTKNKKLNNSKERETIVWIFLFFKK